LGVLKRQVTCFRCGFQAFVNLLSVWDLAGWLVLDYRDGRAICPACVGDEADQTSQEARLGRGTLVCQGNVSARTRIRSIL
jgi:hypothetical protein